MSLNRYPTSDGLQLAFRDDDFTIPGIGAPCIVLHHEFPRNSNFWAGWVPHLSRYMRVVRPDLRGLGLSRVPLETYKPSMDLFVQDALSLLDHLGVEKAVWVGDGTGDMLGLTLAAKHPDRIQALVLCDAVSWVDGDALNASAGKEKDGDAVWFGPGAQEIFAKYGMREYGRYAIRNQPQLKGRSKAYLTWYEEQIAMTDRNLARLFYISLLNVDCRPFLKDIKAPTLLLSGSADGVASAKDRQYILENIPNSREVVFDGPGIGLYYSRPDLCASEVKKFLAGLGIIKAKDNLLAKVLP